MTAKKTERDGATARGSTVNRVRDADKLVLTPSLRVDETAANQEPEAGRDDQHGAGDATGPEAETDFSDAFDGSILDGDDYDDDDDDRAEVATAADVPGEDPQDTRTDPEMTERERRAEELKARVAEFEALVASRQDHWDPDGETPDPNAGAKGDPLPWEEYRPDNLSAEALTDVSDDTDAPGAGEERPGYEDSHVADIPEEASEPGREITDTALPDDEAAEDDPAPVRAEPEEAEPVADAGQEDHPVAGDPAEVAAAGGVMDDGALDESGTQDTPFHGLEAAENDAGTDAPASNDPGPPSDHLAMSEDLLDEEALRDLITEIVHQELQGALGERITRNVRKLVRREIHRALTVQDLD